MGKSVNSHKLPYGKPRIETSPPKPAQPSRIDPVAYIRCWDEYKHREPVDITKSKPMTKADLLKADPRGIEMMLAYGVSQKQIAQQYNTPYGSITAIFKRLGVNTKVETVLPEQKTPEEIKHPETVESVPQTAAEVPADIPLEPQIDPSPPEPVQDDFIWFDQNSRVVSNAGIIVRAKGQVEISAAVGSQIYDNITIGISRDGQNLKLRTTTNGLKPNRHGNRCRLNLRSLAHELTRLNISFPARYVGNWIDNEWSGRLQS